MLGILHLQVPDLVTYWIDDDGEGFKTLFPMVMKVAEAYVPSAIAAEKRFPSNKKAIRSMILMLGHACSCGGDMNDSLADELLDDLSTDGREIYSDKIKAFALKLQLLVKRYGMDIPIRELEHLNGWYLSIGVIWSDNEIIDNFAVVNQNTESYDNKYTA